MVILQPKKQESNLFIDTLKEIPGTVNKLRSSVSNFLRPSQTTQQIEQERRQTVMPTEIKRIKQTQAINNLSYSPTIDPMSYYKNQELYVDPNFVGSLEKIGKKAVQKVVPKLVDLVKKSKTKTLTDFVKSQGLSFIPENAGGEKRIIIDLWPTDNIKGTGITKNETLNSLKNAYSTGNTIIEPSNGLWTSQGKGFIENIKNSGYIKSIDNRGGIERYEITPKIQNYTENSKLSEAWDSINKLNDPLLSEARKYKSAEEFVKAQGTPVYHGTTHKWEGKFKEDRPIFITKDKKFAENVASEQTDNIINKLETEVSPTGESYYPTIKDYIIKKDAKIFSIDNKEDFAKLVNKLPDEFNITNHYIGGQHKITKQDWLKSIKNNNNNWELLEGDVIDEIKKLGYDGWEATERGSNSIGLFSQKALQTKSKLIEIWNNAQGKRVGITLPKKVAIKPTPETSLIQEARKYKSAEEFVNKQSKVYHGTNVKNADMIEKDFRILSPEEHNKFPTTVVGDTQIGLSTSRDKGIADYFNSLQPTGKGKTVELYLSPKTKIYKLPDGINAIDELGTKKLQELKKQGYDAIEDVSNIGGESEIRILNSNVALTKSQLTDIWERANEQSNSGKINGSILLGTAGAGSLFVAGIQPSTVEYKTSDQKGPIIFQPKKQELNIRGIQVDRNSIDQAKKSIMSEISNRLKPVEVTAMLNVAINKAKSEGRDLSEVLSDPNFFQGVTNKRYQTATTSNFEGPDKMTWDFVSNIVDKALANNLPDHTGGATHFVHITSGPMKNAVVTMNEQEFAKYLSFKGPARDTYAKSLLN